MYLNRLYFRKDTGIFITRTFLDDGGTGGISRVPTVDEDFSSNYFLQQYTEDAVIVIELEKGVHEQDFISGRLISIDPDTNELYFSYPDPSNPEEPAPVVPSLTEQLVALQKENTELKLALTELAEAQEADKTEVQIALAELAEIIAGGE